MGRRRRRSLWRHVTQLRGKTKLRMMMKVAVEAAGDVAADDEDGRLQASLVAVAIEAVLRTGAQRKDNATAGS